MKKLLSIGVLCLAGMAVGCSSGKKEAAQKPAANPTDFPPPPQHVETVQTTAVNPNTGGTTVSFERPSGTPELATTKSPGKYTVKKGDTLWSIAKAHYGDGKQYKKIVAANPSIKGERLLVGQSITLPQ